MSTYLTRNAMAMAVATSLQMGAGLASAQEEMGLVLEEIVVTAQKREQSLQEVPATVNAIQGDDLSSLKLFNFSDLEQVTAGLDLRNIGGRAGSVALRGVDFNPNSAGAQAVDVYWNDVTLGANASGGIFQQMFDIGRVEVLRGPQGTLQGRTSPGGAISIHTAKPDLEELEGYVRTTFSDNDGNNTQFSASLPMIPGKLSLRVAGVYDDSELNELKNVVSGDVTSALSKAGRISLAWVASENLDINLVHQYLENNVHDFEQLTGTSVLGLAVPDLEASDNSSITTQPRLYNGRFENTSLSVDWDLGTHQATLVAGYSEVASHRTSDDAPGVNVEGFTAVPGVTSAFPQIGVDNSMLNDPQFFDDRNIASSVELRLASVGDEFWNYTLGVYYGDEKGLVDRGAIREQNLPGAANAYHSVVSKTAFDTQNVGVFAHNIFQLTEQLTAQIGLRWQREESHRTTDVLALEDVVIPNRRGLPLTVINEEQTLLQIVPEALQNDTAEKWTGSVSVQYAFDDPDVVTYVTVGTSFRPGRITISNVNLLDLQQFNEEDSWSVEFGAKATLWDERLRLNAALFYQDYSDYIGRVSRILVNNGGDINRPTNASITTNGDARVQGIELDFEALLSENWRVNGGVSYSDSEYKDGVEIPCNTGTQPPAGAVVNTCDYGGLELGAQPRFSASISTDYVIPMDAVEGYLQALYKFTGRRTDVDAPSGDLGGFGTVDLHLGIRDSGAVWDVSLFARNLFDKQATETQTAGFLAGNGLPTGYQAVQVIPQRLLGVSATYNF